MWQVANPRILRTILFWLIVAVLCPLARGKIVYVDDDAVGANTGTSWTDAFRYLQDALSASQSGDEIRVAQGIYRPDQASASPTVSGRTRRSGSVTSGSGDRAATFQLEDGVSLQGGYAGGGTLTPDTRDLGVYETILSGDLRADDGPGRANTGDNSYHVVTGSGTNETALLDGVTVTAGNANGSGSNGRGGGMYNEAGSPTIINCRFSQNSADEGGAVCINASSPTFRDCLFTYNTSVSSGGAVRLLSSYATIARCSFFKNSTLGGSSANGGAIDNDTSSPEIDDCAFIYNSCAGFSGGAITNYNTSSPRVVNCVFLGNVAGAGGGGIFNWVSSSPLVMNCIFAGNSANEGGGIANNTRCHATVINCTFVGNKARVSGGAMWSLAGSSPVVSNCIFWENTDNGGMNMTESAQIDSDGTGMVLVNYCDIQGLTGALGGTGNIGEAPLFVDADGVDEIVGTEDDDLHLLAESPCIDAGTNAALPPSVSLDLKGNPRIVNGTVDMGAYESIAGPAPRIYYVDAPTGNDSMDGLSLQTAFATVQKGIETADKADTVLVYPGVYEGEVDFLGKAVLVKGVATKAGVPVLENSRGFAVSFYRGEGPDSVLANFVIRNSLIGVFVAGSSPTIRNITLVDNDSGVEAYVGSEPDIANCIFWGNTETDLFQCEARYSCLGLSDGGQHNIRGDPLFVDPVNGDYHLRSERGRYWPEHDVWVLDRISSLCIDHGDPNMPVGQEPMPNGGRINMGAYGGTPYASMSEMPCPVGGAGNAAPQVHITAPAEGAVFYLNIVGTIRIEAEASDTDGSVVKVEFFANGEKIGADTDGGDGWAMDWINPSAGEYELIARATDDDRAGMDSMPIEVQVSSQQPKRR
jgi:predicted outer membrane repeat protein